LVASITEVIAFNLFASQYWRCNSYELLNISLRTIFYNTWTFSNGCGYICNYL